MKQDKPDSTPSAKSTSPIITTLQTPDTSKGQNTHIESTSVIKITSIPRNQSKCTQKILSPIIQIINLDELDVPLRLATSTRFRFRLGTKRYLLRCLNSMRFRGIRWKRVRRARRKMRGWRGMSRIWVRL